MDRNKATLQKKLDKFATQCREEGLKVTHQRLETVGEREVEEVVSLHHQHEFHEHYPSLSRSRPRLFLTVIRTGTSRKAKRSRSWFSMYLTSSLWLDRPIEKTAYPVCHANSAEPFPDAFNRGFSGLGNFTGQIFEIIHIDGWFAVIVFHFQLSLQAVL